MKFKFLTLDKIETIPKKAGVYVFRATKEGNDTYAYVGRSKNLYHRIKYHPVKSRCFSALEENETLFVGYMETDTFKLEQILLSYLKPLFNNDRTKYPPNIGTWPPNKKHEKQIIFEALGINL